MATTHKTARTRKTPQDTQDNAPRLLYDRRSASHQLSISVRSLDYLITNGTIRVRRIGTRILVPHEELLRFARRDHLEPVAGSA